MEIHIIDNPTIAQITVLSGLRVKERVADIEIFWESRILCNID